MALNRRRIQLSIRRRKMLRDIQRKICNRRQTYFLQSLND